MPWCSGEALRLSMADWMSVFNWTSADEYWSSSVDEVGERMSGRTDERENG